jgi:hypothetical protein
MTITRPHRITLLSAALTAIAAGVGLLPSPAGAVSVAKAELKDGQLRVEGHSAPGVFAIVESTTSVASARADQNGLFKVQASGFSAPDCKITIRDGRTPTATVSLAGCTPSVVAVPTVPAAPTSSCVITEQTSATIPLGVPTAVWFDTTGCDTTTNSGATPTPVQWTVIAGVLPTGMTGPNSQGITGGNIIGTPSPPGTYQFTLQVSPDPTAGH